MGRAFNYLRGASISERFWSKVDRKGSGDCWTWMASIDSGGYGNFGVPRDDAPGRFLMQRAHRVAWWLTHGVRLESNQYLCHTCDNRRCCNPDHLFVGTQADNMRDCASKGRIPDRRGERNHKAKLRDGDVLAIRVSNETLSKIAQRYGVAKSSASAARSGKTWRHL